MRPRALIGEGTLSVALDLRHPFAYLAFAPSAELAASLGVEVDWVPMEAATLKPPSAPGPDDDRSIRHRRHRAHAIAREVEVYSEAAGLAIRDLYRNGGADAVNLGWLWLREHAPAALPAYLEDAFRRYWGVDLDPADLDAAEAAVDTRTGDGARFRAWADAEGADVLAAFATEVRGFGLYQSPAYVVDGEVFYGRQHLPMIRWILEGRSGPGPI